MISIRTLLKDWIPPALLRAVHQLRVKGIRFEGNYKTWEDAASLCSGYDAESILDKVLEATLKVKRGEAVFERDSVLFDEIQYSWPVTAALMWAAARNNGNLHVLDFGGSLGSSYFQNRAFLTDMPNVNWSVVEQRHYVDAGQKHIQDDKLRFYSSLDDSIVEKKPNVVLISSVIEYLPDYKIIISEIMDKLDVDLIIVDRSPVSISSYEKICIQRVSSDIFEATLPCRIIPITNLKKIFIDNFYDLMIQYDSLGGSSVDYNYQGFIFKKVKF